VHGQSLRRRADFQRAYHRGASAAGKYVVVYAVPNGLLVTRAGYPVGKKYGGAVRRNRIRRLLRESVRLCPRVPASGYDLVLLPRRRMAEEGPNCQSVLADLESVLERLNLSDTPHPEGEGDDRQS
jgi:ribonuclease P protein component